MRTSQRSRATYPLATLSAYGPASDVRNDPVIAAELADWLRSQGIENTVSYGRIIGCPHEEGIDYPIGRTRPLCPFWAGIDRFTHEPIPAPVAKMSSEQVLVELSKDRSTHPLEALESADAHRRLLEQPLLEVLERCITHPDTASEEEAQLFCYALYLLAKWREARAYSLVIRWLSLSDAASTQLSGDVSTQDGARILAAVYDGDLEPIKRLVLNRDADEFSRGVAVSALALLAVWAEVPRQTVLDYFAWLARQGLERQTNYVWGALASESADIEAVDVFPDLRRAYDEGSIDPRIIGSSEFDDVEASPRGAVLERMKEWARLGRPASSGRAEELALAAAGEFDSGRTDSAKLERAGRFQFLTLGNPGFVRRHDGQAAGVPSVAAAAALPPGTGGETFARQRRVRCVATGTDRPLRRVALERQCGVFRQREIAIH